MKIRSTTALGAVATIILAAACGGAAATPAPTAAPTAADFGSHDSADRGGQ